MITDLSIQSDIILMFLISKINLNLRDDMKMMGYN